MIVLLENQEMARSKIGGAGWPWWCPALPTRGPGLRPWLPRASAGPPAAAMLAAGCRARGPELSAPGLAGPAISPHLQSVQLAAPRDPLGSAGAQLIQDPGAPAGAAKYVGAQPVFGTTCMAIASSTSYIYVPDHTSGLVAHQVS